MSTSWMLKAACKGVDPELFFPVGDDEDDDQPMAKKQINAARAVCRPCPVAADCFEWAMENRKLTRYGMWGATLPRQRDVYRGQHNAREREAS